MSGGSLCPPHEMTPTKLGEPFSELFHQSRFVVDSACEPDMEDAPAALIRLNANFRLKIAYLPDDPRTAAVRGDHEGITPITSLGAVWLRDGAETPAVASAAQRTQRLGVRGQS